MGGVWGFQGQRENKFSRKSLISGFLREILKRQTQQLDCKNCLSITPLQKQATVWHASDEGHDHYSNRMEMMFLFPAFFDKAGRIPRHYSCNHNCYWCRKRIYPAVPCGSY